MPMKYDYSGVEYEGDDFYCYPGTKVLMNRFDIRDGKKLHEIEKEISYVNEGTGVGSVGRHSPLLLTNSE